MGVAFQFPILVFALAKLNIVSASALGKGWRYSLVAISVLAAMITPTVDPVNMALLMAPLFVLYLLSVLVAYIATGKPKNGNENSKEEAN
jgi:sec-independent protein translocase protein TatC